jgi:hypothetical protein
MKRGAIFLGAALLILASAAYAQDKGPAAVSPASEMGIAKVGQLCPTFSWTAVDWATAYRVEVFKSVAGDVLDHKDMAVTSYPVLVKEILGAATSWTPSTDEQLNREDIYVWYVQAIDESGAGMWSQGRFFQIEVALGLAPIEEALNETLEEHGVDREVIDEVIDNVREKAGGGTPTQISGDDPRATTQAGLEYTWKTKLGYYAGQANTSSTGTQNTYIGYYAGRYNVSGDYNTFIGHNAGRNTTVSYNTMVGYNAGYANTTGYDNTFIGYYAGRYNTTGDYNAFVGRDAGYANTSGFDNTFVGFEAGDSNTQGYRNTFIGREAGQANLTGDNNVFMGYQAGYLYTGGNSTFIGTFAGDSTTSGGANTFLGYAAGQANVTGQSNTYVGYAAGYLSTSNYNTMVGYYAGYSNTAANNTFIGYRAGDSNTSGGSNTFIGYNAGQTNTTYNNNTFVGYRAGYSNSGGDRNTYMGSSAGYANSTGYSNTFIGYIAGDSNTNGNRNTFVGAYAGQATTTGDQNTFIGYYAGYTNSTANYNTFLGYGAGDSSNANYNTFLGYYAGQANTTGTENVYVGHRAGNGNTTGTNNVFIGNNAGNSNASGSGNVFLGRRAGYSETGSNRLYIDNSDTSTPLIYGDFANNYVGVHGRLGVGTKTPGYPIELETTGSNAAFVLQRTDGATNYMNATASFGNFGTVTNHPLGLTVNSLHRMVLWADNSVTLQNGASCTAGGTWVNASSRDLKENITMLGVDEALNTLEGLNPVKYNYKADADEDCIGFIAEDVPDSVATKDRKGMSSMDVVAVLTKVLQEQQKINEELRKEIAELKALFKQDK